MFCSEDCILSKLTSWIVNKAISFRLLTISSFFTLSVILETKETKISLTVNFRMLVTLAFGFFSSGDLNCSYPSSFSFGFFDSSAASFIC
jgi:hypothetical protein